MSGFERHQAWNQSQSRSVRLQTDDPQSLQLVENTLPSLKKRGQSNNRSSPANYLQQAEKGGGQRGVFRVSLGYAPVTKV
jgi:hypothetical protein